MSLLQNDIYYENLKESQDRAYNEGSPEHPQFMSDEQREIEKECLANL